MGSLSSPQHLTKSECFAIILLTQADAVLKIKRKANTNLSTLQSPKAGAPLPSQMHRTWSFQAAREPASQEQVEWERLQRLPFITWEH